LSRDKASARRRLAIRAALVTAIVLPLAALDASGVVVEQLNRAFTKSQVTILKGGIIRFSNVDEFDHEVYVDSPNFNYDSYEQSPGETAVVTFTDAGSFEVRCHIHPKMHMHVDVVDH
jgi:plastocyanin